LCLPLGYWLSSGGADNSPEALAMQMFDQSRAFNITINRASGAALPEKVKKMQAVLDMGITAYNGASYAEAITHFNKILSTADIDASQYEEISYLLGISYLANKQAGQAIPIFERLIREETSRKGDSQWYLALALLKEKQVEKGSQLLHTIAEQPHHQKLKKAKELLKLLQ
jgi:tetratricopeptide (TPR) repeat protein